LEKGAAEKGGSGSPGCFFFFFFFFGLGYQLPIMTLPCHGCAQCSRPMCLCFGHGGIQRLPMVGGWGPFLYISLTIQVQLFMVHELGHASLHHGHVVDASHMP
jgi:hypothetical protein